MGLLVASEKKNRPIKSLPVDQDFHEVAPRMVSTRGEIADNLTFFHGDVFVRREDEFLPFENFSSGIHAATVGVVDGVIHDQFLRVTREGGELQAEGERIAKLETGGGGFEFLDFYERLFAGSQQGKCATVSGFEQGA